MTNSIAIGANASVTGSNELQLGNNVTVYTPDGSVHQRSDERDKANVEDLEYPYKEFVLGLRPVTFQWDMREDYLQKFGTDSTGDSYIIQEGPSCINEAIHDGTHIRSRRHNGFIAQEVKQLTDSLGFDFAGYQDHKVNGGLDVLSLGYEEFIPPMVKVIQDQQKQINYLMETIKKMNEG